MARSAKRCPESPAPISGEEELALGLWSSGDAREGIFDPTGRGRLKPEAIKIDDLLPRKGHTDDCGSSTGVSVGRLGFATSFEELRTILSQIVAKKAGRTLEGYAKATIADLWRISGPDARPGILDVLDDGRVDYRSHAVVRATAVIVRSALRGARDELITLFNSNVLRGSF
jgi:hypothetical protein